MTYKIVSKYLPYIFIVLLSLNTNLYNPGSSKSQETHSESSRSRDDRKRKRKSSSSEDSRRKKIRRKPDASPSRHESEIDTIARLRKERDRFKEEKDEVETKSEVLKIKLKALEVENENLYKEKNELKDELNLLESEYYKSKPRLYFSYRYDSDGKMTCEQLAGKLEKFIQSAKDEIYIAVYDFNSLEISTALAKKAEEWKKQEKKVNIRIIFDDKAFCKTGKSLYLFNQMLKKWNFYGISIKKFNHKKWKELVSLSPVEQTIFQERNPIVHHKEAIIDDLVWTGSQNFTLAGNVFNQEHIIITRDPDVRKKAYDNFFALWDNYSETGT